MVPIWLSKKINSAKKADIFKNKFLKISASILCYSASYAALHAKTKFLKTSASILCHSASYAALHAKTKFLKTSASILCHSASYAALHATSNSFISILLPA
jgi:hypothetical protein